MTFQLQLLEQHWLAEDRLHDPCTHGRIRVAINGVIVEPGSEDLGVSQSALALTRTLLTNHTNGRPVAPRLLHHGCGATATSLDMGCPIGANWYVEHHPTSVQITGAARWAHTSHGPTHRFTEADSEVAFTDYALPIVNLAKAALDFSAVEKATYDEWSRAGWIGWQVELRHSLTELEGATAVDRMRVVGEPTADVPAAYRLPRRPGSDSDVMAEFSGFVDLLLKAGQDAGLDLRARDFYALPGWLSLRLRSWNGSSAQQVKRVLQSALPSSKLPAGSSVGVDMPWETHGRR